jgi:hypothetical protein
MGLSHAHEIAGVCAGRGDVDGCLRPVKFCGISLPHIRGTWAASFSLVTRRMAGSMAVVPRTAVGRTSLPAG